MLVTSTDLKTNLGKYLDLLDNEDIVITRNGRKIAKLVKEEDDSLSEIRSLFGLLSGTEFSKMNDEEIKSVIHEERGKRYDRAD
jgi:prevent-host-death family protein